ILELGCGWGSLTLWMAEHFPNARIRAVSNSGSQREHITARAAARKLNNIEVVTADMNEFDAGRQFDRIVSVEMFEHMRNYRVLFKRVHDWLRPGGQFMMHIFCHATTPYEFVPRYNTDWMSRYFFSGGIMPSDNLPLHFQDDLKLRAQWRWDGTHYQRTAEAWLANMDQHEADIMPVFETAFGADAGIWWQRWRIFFLACAELFGTSRGQEWWVSHYRFERPA
ncbi:MAG: class I SAM-dependent methyltransferase, partial [Gammaproteobacteria bacterium]|nr:class I SAM-dependent methyltransferase [Gammaproteobacteria bacterium]